MPPNFADSPAFDPENAAPNFGDEQKSSSNEMASSSREYLSLLQSCNNTVVNLLIGAVVGVNCFFAFRSGFPMSATNVHIVLCVIGYQLIMAQAILSMADTNGWSAKLKLAQRRRAHWVMQIFGSGLAVIGSIIKILDKDVNFNTIHGQLGLAAMIFTGLSLLNGLASLYAYELRKFMSGNISKITHICFGTVAFVLASVCLCFGNDKGLFRNWASHGVTHTIMTFIGIYTFIVIVNPAITFYKKSYNVINK